MLSKTADELLVTEIEGEPAVGVGHRADRCTGQHLDPGLGEGLLQGRARLRLLESHQPVGHLHQARQRHGRLGVQRPLDTVELEQHLFDRIVDLLLAPVHAQDGKPREMADHQHGGDQQRHAAEQRVDAQLHWGILSSASSGTNV